MEDNKFSGYDFDPDFSEYNPLLSDRNFEKQAKEGFFFNLIKKFSCRLLIQLD